MVIELKNISKKYGKKEVLKNVSIQFEHEKLTVLLGENGAGKTTMLRIVSQLESADAGTVTYFGEPLRQKAAHEIVGYVPQDIALFEHMRVDENIACFKALSKNPISDEEIDQYAAQLHLTERKAKVSDLSGGTKRKVNLLIGLIDRPKVLILDEPTVGIDLKSRHDIHRLLNELKKTRLIILTTHHLDEVDALADCIKIIGKDPFYENVVQEKGWSYETLR